jgi:hypothetical protein
MRCMTLTYDHIIPTKCFRPASRSCRSCRFGPRRMVREHHQLQSPGATGDVADETAQLPPEARSIQRLGRANVKGRSKPSEGNL